MSCYHLLFLLYEISTRFLSLDILFDTFNLRNHHFFYSQILCLDECTASVDTKTASILQKTISSVCKGMTVLTIAHRISIVLNMDNVLVLEHGILV